MQQDQAAVELMTLRDREYKCGIDVTLALVGGKWKASILWHLAQETMRFSDLQRQFSDTTRKMLTQQLRELETDGLVHRKVYPQVPPKVEYSLTDQGRTIFPILELMCDWGRNYVQAARLP
ncbi:winged helix-turn-helix transcriptional regulator [Geomonas azotofigens]|uniref:winged helix-turn-helix transcriptional regulator n=1 Tax=Geomonas azotofigens TaxID=2843196 RepID=UPI001C0FD624|nr:helix-turn-helix domain-containing protein [Geomonas azotofigens]MBU5612137.1 helix-turn-helix transcriptional regulator [Geomonas azotofigens]